VDYRYYNLVYGRVGSLLHHRLSHLPNSPFCAESAILLCEFASQLLFGDVEKSVNRIYFSFVLDLFFIATFRSQSIFWSIGGYNDPHRSGSAGLFPKWCLSSPLQAGRRDGFWGAVAQGEALQPLPVPSLLVWHFFMGWLRTLRGHYKKSTATLYTGKNIKRGKEKE
jgi:hypothetical protein